MYIIPNSIYANINKNKIELTLFFLILIFFLNPFYVLIFGALIERKIKIPQFINFFLAFSIALTISNREIGNSWISTSGNFANDDALNYLSYYHDLEFNSFILNYKEYIENIFTGREPIWFFIAEFIGVTTNFNDFILIFFSTLIPVLILHKSFIEVSSNFCINALFFYILVPESFHTIYHLWRFSISTSILILSFSILLNSNKFKKNYIILALLTHLTSILLATTFFLNKEPSFNKTRSIFFIILSQLVKYFITLFLILLIFEYLGFEKLYYYLGSESISKFEYSGRHIFYLILSLILIFKSSNIYIIKFSILNIFILLLPATVPEIGLIIERILMITVPLIPIMLAFEFNNSLYKFLPFIICIYFYYSFKLRSELFYQYISNGSFFSPYNGILFNIWHHQ
jgi:hypothetical protein